MSDEPELLDGAGSGGARPVSIPPELPVLPLRDTVLFPNSFMPLAVARESSVRLIEEAIADSRLVGVFTQLDPGTEEPVQKELYPIGTATHIHKMFKLPDGTLRLIVQGQSRLHLDEVLATKPYIRARVRQADDVLRESDHLAIDALQRNVKGNFQQVVSLSPLLSDDLQALAGNITEPGKLADFNRVQPDHHPDLGPAAGARHARRSRADRAAEPHADQGGRGSRAGLQDPVRGAVRGRPEPARVSAARADEGDSEGAGRGRRARQGDRGAQEEGRGRGHARNRCRRRRSASSTGCPACRWRRPSTRCRGPTSTGSWSCRGTRGP